MKIKKEEFKDKYLRALADYQNLLKRTAIEKDEFAQYASERLILKLLNVLDSLEKAKETLKDKGIEIVYNDLWNILKQEGLVKMVIGKEDAFDPAKMECIAVEEEGKLLQEIRAGYIMKGKVIRPVQVKVIK